MDKKIFLYYGGERNHDINNCYGFYMLKKELEGYYVGVFTQSPENNYAAIQMNPDKGQVFFDGKPTEFKFIHSHGSWEDYWLVAVYTLDKGMNYGETHTITLEGFETADGVAADTETVIFRCTEKLAAYDGYKYEENDLAALYAAREGAVLLKNDGNMLPLTDKRINVFGNIYTRFFNQSGGAGCINPRFSVGFYDGLSEYGGFEFNSELEKSFRADAFFIPDDEMLERAKKYSDTAVITIGRGTSENIDNEPEKGDFYLRDAEDELIRRVSEKFEKTVVIVNTGYQIDMRWVEKYNIKGVLWFALGGMYAGRALSDILTGEENPSGRLPDTWAFDYYDFPSSKNFITNKGVAGIKGYDKTCITNVYEEGIYVGYRYFDTFGVKVAYPFGYGLSYTEFKHEFLSADYDGEFISASVRVTNTGACAGKFSLLAFISKPDTEIEVPAHELVDFAKTGKLAPGESEILKFKINKKDLTVFDGRLPAMVITGGEYKLYIGTDVSALDTVYSIELEYEVISSLHHYCIGDMSFTTLSKRDTATYPKGLSKAEYFKGIFDFAKDTRKTKFKDEEIPHYDGETVYYTDLERDNSLIDKFIGQMSIEELARINVCDQAWRMETNGAAGSIFALEKYKMKRFITADGNSALRIHKKTGGFPSSNMICASFNREMAYSVGKYVAIEAKDEGVHMILAPGMNVHRNPLCGRNAEYFSEDPILSGIMAGFHSKGLQDNGVGATVKHVIGNHAELSRFRSQSIIDERAFREIYVKNFEVAMRIEKPDGLMTAYNAFNNCYTGCDEELIIGVFREELGFDGYVMTDWESCKTCDHVNAVAAGNCWITPGSHDDTFTKPIVEGIKDGRIPLARLQNNIKNFVKVMLKHTVYFEK